MPTYLLGRQQTIYYNAATYGSPSWTKLKRVGDITVDDSRVEADASHRDVEEELVVPTLRSRSLSFTVRANPSDATFVALKAAYENKTEVDVIILNQLISVSGATGPRLAMVVTQFNQGAEIRGLQTRDVILKPTDSDNDPTTYTVS